MNCPQCGFECSPEFAFCPKCATSLRVTCPQCGNESPLDFAFCPRCATPLAAPAAKAPLAGLEDALRKYLPEDRARRLLADQSHLTDDDINEAVAYLQTVLRTAANYLPYHLARRLQDRPAVGRVEGRFWEGTLLFADVSGFTAMTERLTRVSDAPAEEITAIVNRYFEKMIDILVEYEGDLLKFGGDAILCFFEQKRRTPLALNAAWAMQKAMADFSQTETPFGTFPLRMKIGMNTGRVFTASVGRPERMEYVVTGHVVNRCAQAESVASAGQIVASAETIEAARDVAQVCETGTPGFYRVTHVEPAPWLQGIQETLTLRVEKERSPVEQLAYVIDRLEAITPYLATGLLAKLVYEPLPEQPRGDYHPVTVMFVNLVGLSDIIEAVGRDGAQQITEVINLWFVTMQDIIERYGGTLGRVDLYPHGDKLLVFFGAPVTHEDDPERAVCAALEMQAAMKELATVEVAGQQFSLKQRIGLNTGIVLAGDVGSPKPKRRKEYTLMGDDVNLSARLMAAAEWGQILVSTSTYREVKALFEFNPLGEIRVKGKEAPVPVYEVTGTRKRPATTRGIEGRRVPLIGRQQELQTLRGTFEELASGQGHIVTVLGEAGLGKSRLVAEFKDWALSQATATGLTWLDGRCLSYTQASPYRPWLDVIRHYFGIEEGETADTAIAKLRAGLERLMPDRVMDVLPYLAHLLAYELTDAALRDKVVHLDADRLHQQTLLAVEWWAEAAARQQPLVIVFDDLHWADPSSLELLERLFIAVERAPLLLALIFRPERGSGCWQLKEMAEREYPHCFTEVKLDLLSAADGERLLDTLLGGAALPADAKQRILDKAEGNPFFMEEMIRSLMDTGILVEKAGQLALADGAEIADIRVPDTLQGMIQARLDRLTEGQRGVVQTASVVGQEFLYRVLDNVSDEPELEEKLRHLQRVELVALKTRVPEPIYHFENALTRDVAYNSLLKKVRRQIHRRVGECIESLFSERLEEQYGLLAYHFRQGGVLEKEMIYALLAGQRAQRVYANREARQYLERALELVSTLPGDTWAQQASLHESLGDIQMALGAYDEAHRHFDQAFRLREDNDDDPLLRATLCRKKARVYWWQGEYEATLDWLDRAEALLGGEVETPEAARIATQRGSTLLRQGDLGRALEWAERGLALAEAQNDRREIAQALSLLGGIVWRQGDATRTIELCRRSLALCDEIGDWCGRIDALTNLGIALFDQGQWLESRRSLEEALELSRRIEDAARQARTVNNLSWVLTNLGDFDQAIAGYEDALRLYQKSGSAFVIAAIHNNLGAVHVKKGDFQRALSYLQASRQQFDELGATPMLSENARYQAEAYLGLGRLDEADQWADTALALAQEHDCAPDRAAARRVQGMIHRARRNWDEARAILQDSLAQWRELNQPYEIAMTLMELVTLYRDMARAGLETPPIEPLCDEARQTLDRLGTEHDLARLCALTGGD